MSNWQPIETLTQAERDVIAERRAQVTREGFTPEHDDAYLDGELSGAAACYALKGTNHWARKQAVGMFWPFSRVWWKPKSPRADLVRAGALILAEIERLDRAAARAAPSQADITEDLLKKAAKK